MFYLKIAVFGYLLIGLVMGLFALFAHARVLLAARDVMAPQATVLSLFPPLLLCLAIWPIFLSNTATRFFFPRSYKSKAKVLETAACPPDPDSSGSG